MSLSPLTPGRLYQSRYRVIGSFERSQADLWLIDDLEQSRRCLVQLVASWRGHSVAPAHWKRLGEQERQQELTSLERVVSREVDSRRFRHALFLEPRTVLTSTFVPDEGYGGGPPPGIVYSFASHASSLLALANTWAVLVRQVLAETLEALDALHSAQRVHGALRPESIFVVSNASGRFEPRIGGLFCQRFDGRSAGEYVTGAEVYRAPERLDAAAVPQTAEDIWSFGLLSVRALTGRLPFPSGGGLGGISRPRELSHHAPDLSRVVPELRDVLKACLELDPVNRPTAAEVLSHFSGSMPTESGISRPELPSTPPPVSPRKAQLMEPKPPAEALGAEVSPASFEVDFNDPRRPAPQAPNHASGVEQQAGNASPDARRNTAGLFIAEGAVPSWPPRRPNLEAPPAKRRWPSFSWEALGVMLVVAAGVWIFTPADGESHKTQPPLTGAAHVSERPNRPHRTMSGQVQREAPSQSASPLAAAPEQARPGVKAADSWAASMPAMRCEGVATRSVRGSVELLELPCEVSCVMKTDYRGWPSELLGCKAPAGLRTANRRLKLNCVESLSTRGVICSTHVVFQLPDNQDDVVDRLEVRFDAQEP